MPAFRDLSGQRFGRLMALRHVGKSRRGYAWFCKCDCGQETIVAAAILIFGHTRSCGCLRSEKSASRMRGQQFSAKHGESTRLRSTPEYQSWESMIARCCNPNNSGFEDYGGRGITVCARWRFGENGASGFSCFLADMGRRPSPGHSLDRRENDGNYDPSNCRWATRQEQQRNRRITSFLDWEGRQIPLAEAVERRLITYNQFRYLRLKGYEPKDISPMLPLGDRRKLRAGERDV